MEKFLNLDFLAEIYTQRGSSAIKAFAKRLCIKHHASPPLKKDEKGKNKRQKTKHGQLVD